MKYIFTLFILSSYVIFSAYNYSADQSCSGTTDKSKKSAGPPPYYAGAPPEYNSCGAAGCHDGVTGQTNIGPGIATLDLGGANDGYGLGKTYEITISLSRSGMVKSGFQIVAIYDDYYEYSPGIVTLTDNARTMTRDKDNVSWGCCWEYRVWVEHTYDGITPVSNDYNEWSYNWTSPTEDEGSITFYLAINDADGDLTDTMDYNYTLTKTIVYNPNDTLNTDTTSNDTNAAVIANPISSESLLMIFPNPVKGFSQITYTIPEAGSVYLEIYDMTGKKVHQIMQKWRRQGNYREDLNSEGLNPGLYLINLVHNSHRLYSGRFLVLN
ncbi:T9SS type A sorting domain-containing protein [bacterium AH-315-C07]|nr:T9SS type A sorting domain-containing protein [bacterium AH-315-C07]